MDYMNGTEAHEFACEAHGPNNDPSHHSAGAWPRDETERALIMAGRVRDKARGDAEDAARMRHAARRLTYAVHYPSRAFRIEANWDAECGAEWRLNEAALLADENATLTAQLIDYAATKERLTLERILLDDARREISALKAQLAQAEAGKRGSFEALEAALGVTGDLDRQVTALITERDLVRREILALREENNALCAKLDAANARIAALENAALLDVPDEDAETVPGAVRLDRASERQRYNMAPPRRTPPAA